MANSKKTKAQMFAEIKAVAEVAQNEEMVAFLDHQIELATRKRSGSSKPTKNQEKNEEIKEVIKTILADKEDGMTVTEILNVLKAEYADFEVDSNQKVSALVKQMRDAEVVDRVQNGKKVYFVLRAE
jgi:hypothetical protein